LTRVGAYPVSAAQIMYWCEMVRDANARYRLDAPGGMMAPEVSLLTWTQNRATQTGVDARFPDVELPDQPAWPEPAAFDRATAFRMPGTTDLIVKGLVARFGQPIRPGDVISATTQLVDCSELKRTRIGWGYFLTFVDVFTNQAGDVVGHVEMTQVQYGVPAPEEN